MCEFRELTMSRDEWLEFRRSHIGGSDVAAILGLSPWRTPYQVWAEKTGLAVPEDISDRPRVEWGTRLERAVAAKFRESHPKLAVSVPANSYTVLVPEGRPWAMATLDGVVAEADGGRSVLEVKTAHFPTSRDWGEPGDGAAGVPPHYLAQVCHYLSVTGWPRAHVAVLIDGWDYREYVVERDEGDIGRVEGAVDGFWHEHVEAGVPPEVTDARDARVVFAAHAHGDDGLIRPDDETAAMDLVREWRETARVAKTYDARAKDLATRLKATIGDADGLALPSGTLRWNRGTRRVIDRDLMERRAPVMSKRWRAFEDRYKKSVPADRGLKWKDAKDGR